jgi:hypothetical protein
MPASYSGVLLEPVTLWSGPSSTITNLPPTQRHALANKFYADLHGAIAKHCVLITGADPGTIQLRFALVATTAPMMRRPSY